MAKSLLMSIRTTSTAPGKFAQSPFQGWRWDSPACSFFNTSWSQVCGLVFIYGNWEERSQWRRCCNIRRCWNKYFNCSLFLYLRIPGTGSEAIIIKEMKDMRNDFFITVNITLVCWKKQLITAIAFLMGCDTPVTSSVKLGLSMYYKNMFLCTFLVRMGWYVSLVPGRVHFFLLSWV